MKTILLSFQPDGTARSIWTDIIPLASIGTLSVERASTVEFNQEEQLWEVRMGNSPSAPIVHRNASRQACIDWEIAQLQGTL